MHYNAFLCKRYQIFKFLIFQLEIQDWGLIDYGEALKRQESLFKMILEEKQIACRTGKDFLVICEHPHTFTLGKRGKLDDILVTEKELSDEAIGVHHINRGGEVTYHGPGQMVVYPILNLENYFPDVHRYVRFLEEAVIRTLKDFGIISQRISGMTGVWVQKEGAFHKICALGVHLSRWISTHGIAINVNSDLSYFKKIIPCGIVDEEKSVTSMQVELSKYVDLDEVKQRFIYHFQRLFVLNTNV